MEFQVQSLRHQLDLTPTWCAIKVDLSNATAYFQRFVAPPMVIRASSGLMYIMSEGLVQGDPASPLLFALALQPALLQTQLHPKANSSRTWTTCVLLARQMPSSALSPFSKLPVVRSICSLRTKRRTCRQRTPSPSYKCLRLAQLPRKQIALLLLRESVAKSCAHIARINLPEESKAALASEVSLPLSMGGLGLTNLQASRHLAFLASATSCLHTWKRFVPLDDPFLQSTVSQDTPFSKALEAARCHAVQTLDDAQSLIASAELRPAAASRARRKPTTQGKAATWMSTTIPTLASLLTFNKPARMQRHLMQPWHKLAEHELRKTLVDDDLSLAQLNSKSSFQGAAWLRAIPSERALVLSNKDFVLSMRMYLRMQVAPVLKLVGVKTCICDVSKEVDLNVHLLNCSRLSCFTRRHDCLSNAIIQMAASTHQSCRVEEQCDPRPGCLKRFDLSMDDVDGMGRNFRIDITVVNPQSSGMYAGAAKSPMHAATVAAEKKKNKYGEFTGDFEFVPVVLESFGGLHDGVKCIVTALAARVRNQAPEQAVWSAKSFGTYWYQRLSIVLMRQNALTMKLLGKAISNLSGNGESDTDSSDSDPPAGDSSEEEADDQQRHAAVLHALSLAEQAEEDFNDTA
eukprot:m.172459 g.172459  ORF g.172459 m.172459 type:complete len:631 (-) comp53268_c0_seq34:2082-3974(-)